MEMENDTDIANGLSRVAGRVRALAETCQFGFWFITDLHVPSNLGRSGGMLARLIGETGMRHVVSGGDIPEAFGDRAGRPNRRGGRNPAPAPWQPRLHDARRPGRHHGLHIPAAGDAGDGS